jgi:hypothetical protein
MSATLVGILILLFILLLAIIFIASITSSKNDNKIKEKRKEFLEEDIISYIQTSLLMYKNDDLWWTNVPFNGANFAMIIDTGSSTISLPSDICSVCDGPPFIKDMGQKATGNVTYGGGQKMQYYTATVNSPVLGNNISASIVTSGTNPDGKVYNVLGLLNRSLSLKNLILDFPNKMMELNTLDPSKITGLIPSPITDNGNISVNVSGSNEISTVIIDSGTNYVLTDASFPNGFSFTLGNTDIYVPANIIRKNVSSGNAGKVILGNYILEKYKWYFDFDRNLVWVSK